VYNVIVAAAGQRGRLLAQEYPSVTQVPIETVITGHPKELGGFSVRRLLPSAYKRMIGPFIF
jgi:hypothetical protein